MSRRAYHPRRSTVDLVREIATLDGVERVHTVAPARGAWVQKATRLAVYYRGHRLAMFFTLPQARAWLAQQRFEAEALEIARWNPGYAIEGWLAGSEAAEDRARYRRALDLQAEWRQATP